MGIANRRSEDIRELKFNSKELKLFQYGNDAQIALDGSANLIRNVVKLLESDTAIGVPTNNCTDINENKCSCHFDSCYMLR
jgi:hypothetical protein